MAPAPGRVTALRPMLPDDTPKLATIFCAAIETLTEDDYSIDQQAAWMSAADDVPAFGKRLAAWLTLVAVAGGEVVGFASLEQPSRIQMLYVDPEAAGQGVATGLIDAIERLATARGTASLTVEASDTAQSFFARRGYKPKLRTTVGLGGEWLGRTTMDKALGPVSRDDA